MVSAARLSIKQLGADKDAIGRSLPYGQNNKDSSCFNHLTPFCILTAPKADGRNLHEGWLQSCAQESETIRTSSSRSSCNRSISDSILSTHRSLSTRLRALNTIDRPGTPNMETCRNRRRACPPCWTSDVRKRSLRSGCHITKQTAVSSSQVVKPSVER